MTYDISGDRAYELVKKLDYERLAGSDQERKAADLLVEAIQSMGLKAEQQLFEIPAYQVKQAELHLIEPACAADFEVTGYGCSGCTPLCGIEAPLFYAENGEDSNLSQAGGCIVLLNNHPDAKVYQKMVKAKVVGFISVSGNISDDRSATDLDERRLREGRHLKGENPIKIPGLSIRAQDAGRLLEYHPRRCRMILQQDEYRAVSRNIIAEIPGTGCADEYLLFTAHYDTVPFSHGSYDNASGSAIIMELCREIKQNPLRRPCRFLWFGAEEIGLAGSRYYAGQLTDVQKGRIALAINIDLAGQLIGAHHAVVSADASLCGILDFLAREAGFGVNVRHDIFPSDSSSLADIGVPAVSLYRTGCGGHSRKDTAALMSPAALQKTYEWAKLLAYRIGNCVVFPVPHTMPQDIRQKLDDYFGREERI